MKRVVFHIGRGGRFNNPGHKTYAFSIDSLNEFMYYMGYELHTENEGGEELPDEEWKIVDEYGDVILKDRELMERDCIKIDIDGEYDSFIIKPIEECDDDEISILADAYFDETLEDDEVEFELLDLIDDDDMYRQVNREDLRLIENNEDLKLARRIIRDDYNFASNGDTCFIHFDEKSRAQILKVLINKYGYHVEEGDEEYHSLLPLFCYTEEGQQLNTEEMFPKQIYVIGDYKIAFLEET